MWEGKESYLLLQCRMGKLIGSWLENSENLASVVEWSVLELNSHYMQQKGNTLLEVLDTIHEGLLQYYFEGRFVVSYICKP